jgi:eukaryotic-like serine/threonine-protein kinase
MQLSPGIRLGPYEILSPLGVGGMGEVYRARDTRLGRDVAIKILPAAVAEDAERLGRFEREARLLASLNHPNVAAIHGVEEAEGHRYLVLEFVDGETLGHRLARGPLPIDEAVDVCRQIAAGVEAAHESGVVHRDLKPGNVMIAPDGHVKVLDFGLATNRGGGTSASDAHLSQSPTISDHDTQAGVILGTAAYMSPEQARGRTVDRRTDIWSFGCVLYETLTGRALFAGETVSDLIAQILEREPDWSALPKDAPHYIRELLKRCLRKDPKTRLRDIGDARIELTDAHPIETPAAPALIAARVRRLPWIVLCAVLALALVASFLARTRHPSGERTMRVSIPLPPGLEISLEVPDATISPDGRTILCAASDSTGTTRLYVRPLNSATFRAVPGTEGAVIPFWSPDSRQIAFFAGGNLKRMGINGDGAQVLCPASSPRGGAWGSDDIIVIAPNASGPLMQIPASGGTPKPATTLDTARGETAHRFPSFLPGGKHFLYVALPGKDGNVETRVGALDGTLGPVLLTSPNTATYAEPGYLLFNQNGSVVAQPFDAGSFKLSGTPRLVPDLFNASASYSGSPVVLASRDGTLIQRELRHSGQRIVLMDRSGKLIRSLALPEGEYAGLQFSPDGSRLAVTFNQIGATETHVWLIDLARSIATRFAFDGQYDSPPRWTPDGKYLVWGSDRANGRDIYWKQADGTGSEELVADVPNLFNDPSSAGNDFVVYRSLSGETSEDIWMVGLRGDRTPTPLLRTTFNEINGVVSPNGRWMAYRCDESGRFEIYVARFPEMDRKLRVSSDGAAPLVSTPFVLIAWRNDGNELYYIGGDGRTAMAVPVDTGEEFLAGTPKPLFRLPGSAGDASIAPDGKTLAVAVPAEGENRSILNLVVDWSSEATKPER